MANSKFLLLFCLHCTAWYSGTNGSTHGGEFHPGIWPVVFYDKESEKLKVTKLESKPIKTQNGNL